jgi:hypothetical protein
VWRDARQSGEKRAPARDQDMQRLRHTAASAWLAAGFDRVSVAAWLGDTVPTVRETHAHLMPDSDDRSRSVMDVFFKASALNVPSEDAI